MDYSSDWKSSLSERRSLYDSISRSIRISFSREMPRRSLALPYSPVSNTLEYLMKNFLVGISCLAFIACAPANDSYVVTPDEQNIMSADGNFQVDFETDTITSLNKDGEKTTIVLGDEVSITTETDIGLRTLYPSSLKMTISTDCPMFDLTYSNCTSNSFGAFPDRSIEQTHETCDIVASESVETYGCD